jgi:DNA-binding protein Fis
MAAERASAGAPTDRWAHAVTELVPAIVGAQLAGGSRRVYRDTMSVMERPLLAHVLSLTGGNQLRAARLLGLNRNTLRKRCRDLGLDVKRRPTAGAPR